MKKAHCHLVSELQASVDDTLGCGLLIAVYLDSRLVVSSA